MKKIAIMVALVAAGLCSIWYFVSPAYAVEGLAAAVVDGDRTKLEERVDFPRVRESVKNQITAKMRSEMNYDNPLELAGAAMASKMVEVMVDEFATPDGIIAFVNKKMADEEASGISFDMDKFEIVRADFNHFKVRRKDAADNTHFLFERDGINWKLVDFVVDEEPPADFVS